MRVSIEELRAWVLLSALALPSRAVATGMVAQTFHHQDAVAGSGVVAEHHGDVLIGSACSSAEGDSAVYLFDAENGRSS